MKNAGKWFNKNVIQPGKKLLTQAVKWTTDAMIDNNPVMSALGAVDKDAANRIGNFLKDRKDKIGSACKEFLEGLGDAVSNPIHTAISLLRLASGNPDDWERVVDSVKESFEKDPEKATYRTLFEVFGLKGAGKVLSKVGSAGRAATEGVLVQRTLCGVLCSCLGGFCPAKNGIFSGKRAKVASRRERIFEKFMPRGEA